MSGYQTPCGDIYVPDDWAGHRNRNPPSPEPGTDYAAPYGTEIACAAAGTVYNLQSAPNGGTGRFVEVRLDDGRAVRYLHLSEIYVQVGYRVSRGAILAASGASGNGSNWYYGAHVHVTLLPTWTTPLNQSIDFQLYVGDDDNPTPPEEPDVPLTNDEIQSIAYNAAKAVWGYEMNGGTGSNAVPSETGGERLRNIRRSTDGLKSRTERIDTNTAPKGSTQSEGGHRLAIVVLLVLGVVALAGQLLLGVWTAANGG